MTPSTQCGPTLAIIIVNWNVCDLLRDCLAAVSASAALRPLSVDTIVIDNASADGSAAMVRAQFPWARLIESGANLGFAKGCQLGYEATDAPFVMLLNPDTLVDPDAIASMLAQMEGDDRIGILGSRLRNSDGSFQRASGGAFPTLRNLAWNYLFLNKILPRDWAPPAVYLDGDPPGVRPIDWVSGASLTFRRAAVGARIFHPAYFMFGEDMELCHRVAQAGWRVLYSARQSITHHHGASFARQSSMEVLASVYKGPRFFFRQGRGPLARAAYDAILFTGYASRWLLFSLLGLLRPNRDYHAMARFSRRYLGVMAATIFTRHPHRPAREQQP
ncbi:glycosyltransferase family 2 protein [Sphingomonas bisphenolicum]|uniref:Glycosyl transferase n=1 Tax=Sphingomonas bisphenolicum TaxID=296544 RepID=A0ABM7G907_9SPHN|nr:glycosyltransferase family 2 protein [Sphingomonas bisphenolicum]BBF71753.1 glycosyl transferase [Sphingomonas bisphenolicum]